ncbi:MAG: SIR2 family protein [Deltaproteobacteria bacterium]|nr:SIR2 family protein [Deltaproteobacteria bacterium]
MVTDKICRDVITTNYDLFFDSVWAKYPDLNIVQNPVAHRDEFLWDGYYSYRQKARGKPRYWKIHGSLSHVVFRAQTNLHNWQILRLPRFPISTNQPDLPKAFGAKCLAPFLGYESGIYPNTRFTHPYTLDPQFDPFIDWSYGSKRDLFRREIEGAKKVLKQRAQIAAVVIIGFRGYYNHKDPNDTWNEELVPILDGILNAGAPPVFMAIHEKQYAKIDEPTSQFMKRLENIDRCRSYKKVRHFLEALLYKYSKYFPYRSVGSEYAIWRTHWFLSMKEPKHA